MLNKLLAIFCLFLAVAMFTFVNPNCNACHAGGMNVVSGAKTLKKDALDKYGMNSVEAVVNQVTNGKNAMPAFKGRLTDAQIEDVATYVISQAEKGW